MPCALVLLRSTRLVQNACCSGKLGCAITQYRCISKSFPQWKGSSFIVVFLTKQIDEMAAVFAFLSRRQSFLRPKKNVGQPTVICSHIPGALWPTYKTTWSNTLSVTFLSRRLAALQRAFCFMLAALRGGSSRYYAPQRWQHALSPPPLPIRRNNDSFKVVFQSCNSFTTPPWHPLKQIGTGYNVSSDCKSSSQNPGKWTSQEVTATLRAIYQGT